MLEDAVCRPGLTAAAKGTSEVVHHSDNSEAKTPPSLAALRDSSVQALRLGAPAPRLSCSSPLVRGGMATTQPRSHCR